MKKKTKNKVKENMKQLARYCVRICTLGVIVSSLVLVAVLMMPNIFSDVPRVQQVVVTRIIDGDTIVVMYQGNEERVRLIGIDTPEIDEDGADAATAFTTNRINELGGVVWLETAGEDRDRFGRLRRHVWLTDPTYNEIRSNPGQYLLNQQLLDAGYAEIWGGGIDER